MKIQQLSVEAACAAVRSRPAGLTGAEAQARLAEFGPNALEAVAGEPLVRRIARQFLHFFAIVLWLAAGIAFYADLRQPGEGMALMGAAIIVVILVNGAFSFWQEQRAEQTAAALRRLLPHRVRVRRDGLLATLPTQALVPGDVIELAAGDLVPADARLLEANALRIDAATISGESVAHVRVPDPDAEEDPIRCGNLVLAGTTVVAGRALALVYATGTHAEFGRIARLTEATVKGASPLQKELVTLGRIVAALAVGLGVVFFGIGTLLGLSFWQNLIFAIGIIVANVPEGLLPTYSLALAMGARRMARKRALIRHLPSVETLGSTTVICTDKTGTLTLNRMRVHGLFVDGRRIPAAALPADAAGARPWGALLEAMARCHALERDAQGGYAGDPLEVAMVTWALPRLDPVAPTERLGEVPFDSSRMRYSALERTASGTMLYTKGALEAVLPLCRHLRIEGEDVPIHTRLREELVAAQEHMAERGLKVLAVAARAAQDTEITGEAERDLVLLGLVGLEDPPRPEVPEAIRRCRAAGIRVIMVTGDHPGTAVAVAREVGIVGTDEPLIVTGRRLARMSASELQLALDAPEIIFARLGPDQKLRIVETLQRKRHVVAVTGDGVNDAPALKQADIGIAMGRSGTDVAREAADMVLLDDNFATIVAAIEEGRAVYDNIRRFLTYILASNVPEMLPYIAYVLLPIPLPLTIIQILAVDLGTDMLPALGLGGEPPRRDPLAMGPLAPRRLLDRALFLRAYLFLGLIEAVAAMCVYFLTLRAGGWTWGERLAAGDMLALQAATACLATIVVMQMVNVFHCRDEQASGLERGALRNRLILAGVGAEAVLLAFIVYTPWGQALFGTAPLPAAVWLMLPPFAALFLGAEELRKWIARRRAGRSGHPA